MAESLHGLQSVLLLDQHERWQQGDRPNVESYLQVIPELGSDRRRLLDVIYQEILLREQAGEAPAVEEYVARFPALARDLRLQFEVHVGLPADGLKPAEAPWPSRPTIEGYRIEAELGRGTFGVVYKAREEKLKRQVAIKLLRPADDGEESSPEVSLREAQSIARLVHPNIVQIYAVGETQQGLFFSQELIEGGTLTRLINGFPQPARSAAAFMATLADAVHYAHLCKVIHCDLKPSNILLRRKTADGAPAGRNLLQEVEPKVSDFGLALHMDADGVAAGSRLRGTLHYMAPEQTGGETPTVGPATDVYALGAILYELLTGAPPFANDSKLKVFLKVRNESPDSPRRLNPEVPADLDAICLKCLEKSPSRRYQSAAALAEDLRRYLAGHVPLAVDAGSAERIVRWGRRNPAIAGLLAALVVVVATGFAGVTAKMIDARRAEASEHARADELDAALYRNKFLLASRAWEAGDLVDAQRILEQTNPARRSFEWFYLQRLCAEAGHSLPWPGLYVSSLAYGPSGDRLVLGDAGNAALIVDAETGAVLHRLEGHETQLASPAISPDGARVATVETESGDSWIRLWSLRTGEKLQRIGSLRGHALALAFTADGELVSVSDSSTAGSRSLEIEVWDLATGKQRRRTTASYLLDSDQVAVALSPDGQTLAVWSPLVSIASPVLGIPSGGFADRYGPKFSLDHKVLLIEVKSGETTSVLEGHRHAIGVCEFSPDGRSLLTGDMDGKVILWEAATGSQKRILREMGAPVRAAAFRPDGQTVATAGTDRQVTCWEMETGRRTHKFGGHDSDVHYLAFAPDGRSLASVDVMNRIQIWNLAAPPVLTSQEASAVTDIAWIDQGRSVVYTNKEDELFIRDVADSIELFREMGKGCSIAESRDARRLAVVEKSGRLLLSAEDAPLAFEPVDGIPLVSNACPIPMAFSGDGTQLACIERGGRSAFILDVVKRQVVLQIPTPDSILKTIAIRDDGELLAIGSLNPQVLLHDRKTGKVIKTLATQYPVRGLVFRPGSDDLAVIGSVDRFVEIWNTSTGTSRLVISGNHSKAEDLVFTPDGKRMIMAGPGKSVTVWDADSGDELLVLDDADDLPFHLAMSADGRKLGATVGQALDSGKIVIWDGSGKKDLSD